MAVMVAPRKTGQGWTSVVLVFKADGNGGGRCGNGECGVSGVAGVG